MDRIVIVGTSSTAKNVHNFIKEYSLYEVLGFAVNQRYKTKKSFCGLPVYTIETLDSVIDKQKDFLFVAIQWNNLNADRRSVYEQLKAKGYKFANLISPNAIIHGEIKGDNCWIADYVVIDFSSSVYNNVFLKIGASILDNVTIYDHCFVGAKSLIAGGCKIGEQSFVGLSATIFDDVTIGKKCIIGASTSVKRNMNDYSLIKTDINNNIVKVYSKDTIEGKLQFQKNVR